MDIEEIDDILSPLDPSPHRLYTLSETSSTEESVRFVDEYCTRPRIRRSPAFRNLPQIPDINESSHESNSSSEESRYIDSLLPQSKSHRVFSLLNATTGKLKGRYSSEDPSQVANECFTKLVESGNILSDGETIIFIQEITLNSDHKIYKYKCKRYEVSNSELDAKVNFRYYNWILPMPIAI